MIVQTPTQEAEFPRFSKTNAEEGLKINLTGQIVNNLEVGQDYEDYDERMVGGTAEKPRPWLAQIISNEGGQEFEAARKCGGTLINHWYVLTASHCVCDTMYSERLSRGFCLEKTPRIKITKDSRRKFDVCIGLTNSAECKEEIATGMAYSGRELVIQEERLKPSNDLTHDIALLKLDRKVAFTADVSPICLAGLIDLKPIEDENAYISGFGNDGNVKKNSADRVANKAECSTDKLLPRPYHFCTGECFNTSLPSASEADGYVCNWLIYNHFDQVDPTADMLRIRISNRRKAVTCFSNQKRYGWCLVNDTVSHVDFDGMPNWGFCDSQCRSGINNQTKKRYFEISSGRALWGRVTLLQHKTCQYLVQGITGATLGMSSGYNTTTEICAANKIKPVVQKFKIDNFKFNATTHEIEGNVSYVETTTTMFPAFYGVCLRKGHLPRG